MVKTVFFKFNKKLFTMKKVFIFSILILLIVANLTITIKSGSNSKINFELKNLSYADDESGEKRYD